MALALGISAMVSPAILAARVLPHLFRETASGPMKMLPFPDIEDERYATFLKVA